MKHLFLQLICLLFFANQSLAQHYSLDIPVLSDRFQDGIMERTIDISREDLPEVSAVSVVLEGEEMSATAVRCLIWEHEQWQLIPHFHESEEAGRYVSELHFLPQEPAGEIRMRIALTTGRLSGRFTGRIHVFGAVDKAISAANLPQETGVDESVDCSCPQPVFVPRTVWGSSFGLTGDIYTPPAVYTDVTHLIVHHSAGTNTSSNWAGVVASIFDYHVNTNGWSDVGYNWLIDPNGVLYEGRGGGDNVRGAHMCGYNNNTMGVCLLGNFVSVSPPPAALATLKKLLAWKSCKEDIDPVTSGPIVSHTGFMAHISGHRDGCAPNYTECPGGLLYGQLAALRLSVADEIATACSGPTDTRFLPQGTAALALWPNPVSDILTVSWPDNESPPGWIRLSDVCGRVAGQYIPAPQSGSFTINTSSLPSGMYSIVGGNEKRIFTSVFVKY